MKFRKKPVEIEAEQYHAGQPLPPGACDKLGPEHLHNGFMGGIHVHTLEGTSYRLDDGDWVIRGIQGEYYPCKPDIFAATYDVV